MSITLTVKTRSNLLNRNDEIAMVVLPDIEVMKVVTAACERACFMNDINQLNITNLNNNRSMLNYNDRIADLGCSNNDTLLITIN